VCRRSSLLTGEAGEGGWGGAKSYEGEKVWSSINHSIFSGIQYLLAMGACILFSELKCKNKIQTSCERKNVETLQYVYRVRKTQNSIEQIRIEIE
jgi:hypothetical protein